MAVVVIICGSSTGATYSWTIILIAAVLPLGAVAVNVVSPISSPFIITVIPFV